MSSHQPALNQYDILISNQASKRLGQPMMTRKEFCCRLSVFRRDEEARIDSSIVAFYTSHLLHGVHAAMYSFIYTSLKDTFQ